MDLLIEVRRTIFAAYWLQLTVYCVAAHRHLDFLCFFANNRDFLPDQSYMLPAYEIAIAEITAQYNLSASVSVISAPFLKSCDDLQSNTYVVPQYYYQQWLPQRSPASLPVFFLNGCDEGNEVARFTREWDILTIATSATPSDQRPHPTAYPTLVSFATVDTTKANQGILSILSFFGWTTVYMVYDTWLKNLYYTWFPSAIERIVRDPRFPLGAQFNLISVGWNSSGIIPYEQLLRPAINTSRVIMVLFRGEEMRNFLIAADRLNMLNGEYIFLTCEPFENERRFGALSWFKNDSGDAIARRAFRYVMKFTTTFKQRGATGEKDALARQIKAQGIEKYGAWYTDEEKPNPGPLAAYIAVKALGQVLTELPETGAIPNGSTLASAFRSRRFTSRGVTASMDATAVRVPVLYLEDYNADLDTFQTAVIYDASLNASHPVTIISNYSIDWATADNRPPLNVPRCGYRGDNGPCSPATDLLRMVLTPVLTVSIFAWIVAAVYVWHFRRKGIHAAGQWWVLDVHLISDVCYSMTSTVVKTNAQRRMSIYPTKPSSSLYMEITPCHMYKNSPVVIKKFPLRQKVVGVNRSEEEQLRRLGQLDHTNLVRLYGLAFQSDELWCVLEFLAKGHLKDLIEHIQLDWDLCIMLSYDLIAGMRTIHRSVFKYHGYVTPYTCMISKNLTLKISDCGLHSIAGRHCLQEKHSSLPESAEDLARWFAPEIRHKLSFCDDLMQMSPLGAAAGDVYSAASIIHWMLKSYRPLSDDYTNCLIIVEKCLSSAPEQRDAEVLWKFFQRRMGSGESMVERMIRKADSYTRKLEEVVKERTVHLQREQQLTESLLQEMLPNAIIQRLLSGQSVDPELYPSVTVGFSIFEGFVGFVAKNTPWRVVEFLGEAFSLFDDYSAAFDVYKVESISDCYMVVSGLPVPNGTHHAAEVCTLALRLRSVFMKAFGKTGLEIMIGIHSGECAAGLVGTQRPRYCLFGDTVNVASRLASHSTGCKVQTSAETVALLPHPSQITVTSRGLTELKVTHHDFAADR
ncbi:atrial natriuretic peptide receptor 1-like [Paramacrobiotus metropolitanus]|uniref:atrial natriuretic peptide receptor 1-like n=1 Tax=Paramacrobiotus metropolitanus TaxID=2943436 RepID=UPI0024461B12|nr:atrial natriuretic peptide receptor 1-like [Paramacrobiotus metropolitanus]